MSWLWHSWTVVILFHLHVCLSSSSSSSSSKPRTADLFESWCQEYGKTYSSEQEKQYRHGVFKDNYDYITQHNSKGNSTYTLSLNAFADLTHHEFKAQYLGLSASANNLIRLNRGSSSSFGTSDVFDDRDIPSSVDWRMKGAVTNVKNQGRCGAKRVDWGYRFARVMYDFIVSGVTPVVKTYSACWAFSATGAIEGINKIVTGSLVSLSEQELIDCDRSYNNGCEGGLMDSAYQFVVRNNGIDTENDYPFQGQDGACNRNKLERRVVTIDGYRDVPAGNEKALLKAVATQPVSVGICGSERAFQLYSGGIFAGPCSTSLDHAVLIVGYDSHDGVDYWIVKNSWGTSWGIKGYIHMARSNGNSEGVCGINMLPSYPVKTSPNPPSPPSPAPVKCNLFTSCSGGETCCCSRQLLGFCFSWKCCELESAVCCKDHRHCCPQDYPICDTERNLCLMETGNTTLVKPFKNQGLSGVRGNWNSLFQDWIL